MTNVNDLKLRKWRALRGIAKSARHCEAYLKAAAHDPKNHSARSFAQKSADNAWWWVGQLKRVQGELDAVSA